uniref:Uncharacterized protein n=1 Tax=Ciona savignyi TaxID=51511 RepID=H2YEB3_CIOSA
MSNSKGNSYYQGFQAASSTSDYNAQGYKSQSFISAAGNVGASFAKASAKHKKITDAEDEDYFNDGPEETSDDILAACPFLSEDEKKDMLEKDDVEDDPLEAFMAGIEQEVTTLKKKSATTETVAKPKQDRGVRDDLEELDSEELYYKYMVDNPNAGKMFLDEDEPVEYDEEGNPIPVQTPNKKLIDPLPVVYHSEIEYPAFEKNFYTEHEEIKSLTADRVDSLRRMLGIK